MPPTRTVPGDTRRTPLALLAAAALLLVLRIAVTVWEERHPAPAVGLIQWVPLPYATELAKQTGKPILYEFGAEWCGPCQQMKREVFAQATPAHRLESMVVPVELVDRRQEDGRNDPRVDSLQRAFSVDGFPTLVIYSPESGRSVSTSGYSGSDATLRWIAQGVVEVRMAAPPQAARGH